MLKSFLDWAVLPETLPLLVIVFIMGIYANSYIERYIRNHAEVFPDTPFSVLLRAVRGMPRLWCIIAACYWVLHVINLSD